MSVQIQDRRASSKCVFGMYLDHFSHSIVTPASVMLLTSSIYFVQTVGNIPYDATEEQLVEIFKEVGPVVNFR